MMSKPKFTASNIGKRCELCNHTWDEHPWDGLEKRCPPIKYVVEVKEVHRLFCEIESLVPLTRAELLERANAQIEAGEQGDYLEYDRTLDPSEWVCRTEKGDFVE